MQAAWRKPIVRGVSVDWYALAALPLWLAELALIITGGLTEGIVDDFRIFYAAGYVVAHGGSPYNYAAMHAAPTAPVFGNPGSHLLFPYLPFVAWIFAPLTVFRPDVAYVLWGTILFLLLSIATYLWVRHHNKRWAAIAVCVTVVSMPSLINFLLGQTSILIAVAVIGAVLMAQSRRYAWAGVLSTIAAMIKPQDAWLLVPLIWVTATTRPELKAAIAAQASTASLLLLLPMATNHQILMDWIHFAKIYASTPNSGSINGIGIASSLAGWMPKALLLNPILALMGLLTVSFLTLRLHRSPHLQRISHSRRTGWLILAPLTLWLLWTPYANPQDFIILLPFLIFVIATPNIPAKRAIITLLLTTVLFIPAFQQVVIHHINTNTDIEFIALLITLYVGVRAYKAEANASFRTPLTIESTAVSSDAS